METECALDVEKIEECTETTETKEENGRLGEIRKTGKERYTSVNKMSVRERGGGE